MSYAKKWCFTLNNYTEDEQEALRSLFESPACEYAIVGKEQGENGTPHLQGYVCFAQRKRLASIKKEAGFGRAHLEVSKGNVQQNVTYCSKEGDFEEFGDKRKVGCQGKRSDFECFREWCVAFEGYPDKKDIWEAYPTLAARYPQAVQECVDLFCKPVQLCPAQVELRDWQRKLQEVLSQPADDRKIIFVVDEEGSAGKSFFCRYLFDQRGSDIQRLSVGKRDDLAHAIDATKCIFVFDVPRGQLQFLQYSVLEQLKDRMVFSPKYHSTTKVLKKQPHVLVMCNEYPDKEALTKDRYHIIVIKQLKTS